MDVSYINSKEKLLIGSGLNFIDIYSFSINNIKDTKMSLKNHLIKRVFCPENCIIYSMSINEFNSLKNKVTIASGTVFNNLIIWEIDFDHNYEV